MNTSRGFGEPLANLEATLAEVEQVPKMRRIERRVNRYIEMMIVLSLLIAILSSMWSAWNSIQIARNTVLYTNRVCVVEEK